MLPLPERLYPCGRAVPVPAKWVSVVPFWETLRNRKPIIDSAALGKESIVFPAIPDGMTLAREISRLTRPLAQIAQLIIYNRRFALWDYGPKPAARQFHG